MGVVKSIERKLVKVFNQKKRRLNNTKPIVSFTFDDFPESAFNIAGKILKKKNFKATYYLAAGLLGRHNDGMDICTRQDVFEAYKEGHEIGCHTYEHLDCQDASVEAIRLSIFNNSNVIKDITGQAPVSFSYPFGRLSFKAREFLSDMFLSSRGVSQGLNNNMCDVSNLRSYPIYSKTFDIDDVEAVVKNAIRNNAWLIFYTHDVCENPTDYGCTPSEFESVVNLIALYEIDTLTIGQVIDRVVM